MKDERISCSWVILAYLATVIVWIILGKLSWNYLHPEIFKETFSWFIIWNIITAGVNSVLFILFISLASKYQKT